MMNGNFSRHVCHEADLDAKLKINFGWPKFVPAEMLALVKWHVLLGSQGLFTPKTRVFSAAEILLRIYQNPIHLNGTRWPTTFWRQREVRRRKKNAKRRGQISCLT